MEDISNLDRLLAMPLIIPWSPRAAPFGKLDNEYKNCSGDSSLILVFRNAKLFTQEEQLAVGEPQMVITVKNTMQMGSEEAEPVVTTFALPKVCKSEPC